jgi:hypothetical protein
MCLKLTKFSKLHTAKEDIVAYKIIRENIFEKGNYLTCYMGSPVEIGKTYFSKLVINNEDATFIVECEEGLHSFKTLKGLKKTAKHIYLPLPVKCIIPKGAHYYKGYFNGKSSYASDALTYIELI